MCMWGWAYSQCACRGWGPMFMSKFYILYFQRVIFLGRVSPLVFALLNISGQLVCDQFFYQHLSSHSWSARIKDVCLSVQPFLWIRDLSSGSQGCVTSIITSHPRNYLAGGQLPKCSLN